MAVFILSGSFDFCFDSFIIRINSGDKMDQKCLYSAGHPSGPGDLLFGISLRALKNSCSVNGDSRVFIWCLLS